ncbi:hypothetical protein FRD01_22065 [Microvenator marinus]|uniref:Uncharacterized protein n=1 Tax=Microvenator marinus TaxID=2600177 RepID=A0A5B8Y2E6_9DELT|nr:hypothetical protein [Microvenator marinus]QED29869.1 hypothetical protein FRD01_22065 [Microvenator marinus]
MGKGYEVYNHGGTRESKLATICLTSNILTTRPTDIFSMTNQIESWIQKAKPIEEWHSDDFDECPEFPIYMLAPEDAKIVWGSVVGEAKNMFVGFPDDHWTNKKTKLGTHSMDEEDCDVGEQLETLRLAVDWQLDTWVLLLFGRGVVAVGQLESFLQRWIDMMGFEMFFLTNANGDWKEELVFVAGPNIFKCET